MATLTPDVPVATTTSTLRVGNRLTIGPHSFQLVVVNNRGKKSRPATVTVDVRRTLRGIGGVSPLGGTMVGHLMRFPGRVPGGGP